MMVKVEGVRVGPHCSGAKPIGCHDKLHHVVKQNVTGSAFIVCLGFCLVGVICKVRVVVWAC